MEKTGARSRWQLIGEFGLVTLVALGVFAVYGFDGWLWRDDAVYVYAGQRVADGVPPYVGIFDHKTPLSPMLAGFAVWVGKAVSVDAVLSVRFLFWIISGLTAGSLYLLGKAIWQRAEAGWFVAASLLPFWSFGREAVSGPRAKTPMVLFEVLYFYCIVKGYWFGAGVFAALATWVWQPGVVFVLIGAAWVFVSKRGETRIRNIVRYSAGVFVPCVLCFLYFLYHGAVEDLWAGAVTFNLTYLHRPPFAFGERLWEPLAALFKGYTLMGIPSLLGLLFLAAWGHYQYHYARSGACWRASKVLYITLPFPLAWTIIDFQGAADLYPLIPYFCVGFGGLLWWIARERDDLSWRGQPLSRWITAGVVAVLVLGAIVEYARTRESGLEDQRASAAQIDRRLGANARVLSIGLPEVLVLTGKTNPNPYVFIIAGIDRKIAAETPGGFQGWIRQLEKWEPDAVGVGQTEGEHWGKLKSWLETHFKKQRFGYFDIYVRNNVAFGERKESPATTSSLNERKKQ